MNSKKLQSSLPQLLGAGRSGKVFLIDSPIGQLARKVFYSDKIASLIHYVFFGSPNPYVWNEDAIYCAFYRRKILGALVAFWFGDRLQVSDSIAIAWNPEFKAYQMDTVFVKGRHVALRQPCSQERDYELSALVYGIMIPLQTRLIKSGFDGLVWQAGKGTPTALNNFMLVDTPTGNPIFAWIDMESGVPALFPINLFRLFSFYLPKSLQYGRALFDDVNCVKLKRYLNYRKQELERCWGHQRYAEMLELAERLEYHQYHWKSMRRVDRSIQYQLKKGAIDERQARWYTKRPLLWYGKELLRISAEVINLLLFDLPLLIINRLANFPYKRFLRQAWLFITSQRFRLNLVNEHIRNRIHQWHDRKHLSDDEARYLLDQQQHDRSSDYITDFGVHLGIKLFFKVIEFGIAPILYLMGWISGPFFIAWMIAGGPLYRTTYTVGRMLQAVWAQRNSEGTARAQEIPWVAFWVGLLPTFGNMAYPCQITYSARGRRKKVAQFIVYDFLTRIGERIPAWGGEDTQTEHFFNRLAARIAHR